MFKNIWEFKECNEALAKEICQHLNVSMVISRLLVQRSINGIDEARDFLYAGLDRLTDPWAIRGISEAVERIRRAIVCHQKVIIYGDYDVDGICSIVILKECLDYLGSQVDYYVPNRFSEGYGLNKEALELLARQGCQLLITVDCGISSVEETKWAMNHGIDVIITDHHTPPPVQPPAMVIINPKNDDIKATVNLAGAGVAFKLASALAAGRMPKEKIYEWLDLAALATVADIVPLLDENRIMVKHGLHALENTRRPGLRALIRETGLEGKHIQSWQVGFVLAPRLNSAGRLESARTSVELLTCQIEQEAAEKAALLSKLNNERRLIEEAIYQEAFEQVKSGINLEEEPVLVVGGDGWHQGVIGIVASRLTEAYNRPTIVISWESDIGKGSARSVDGFDLYEALHQAESYLLNFGGHKMAAGLSINRNQLSSFKTGLKQFARTSIEFNRYKRYQADMEIEEEDIDHKLVDEIEALRPFGEGNPVPRFVLRASAIRSPAWVGNNRAHLKFRTGINNIEAIAFNRADMTDYPLQNCGQDLLFELDVNDFRGKKNLQLKIKDMKSAFVSDKLTNEDNNLRRVAQALRRAVQEIKEKRPVLIIYPTYRSLIKHKGVLEYFLNKHNIQTIHGHLAPEERGMAQEMLARGINRVFLITRPFLEYCQNSASLPANLRYMVQMWPSTDHCQYLSDSGGQELDTISQTDKLIFYHSQEIAANKGRILVYANLPKTVNRLNNNYPDINIESGLVDMSKRRAVRKQYIAKARGVLLNDGTHTAGWPNINEIDEMILADSPLGWYELAAITDYLHPRKELKIGVAFDKTSLEYNRNFLKRIYPDVDTIKVFLSYYTQYRFGKSRISIDELITAVNMHFNIKYSPLEILSILRVLADLGLCQLEKSGSIIAINFVDTGKSASSIRSTPYYLEGVAEKQLLAEWEKKLNNSLVW